VMHAHIFCPKSASGTGTQAAVTTFFYTVRKFYLDKKRRETITAQNGGLALRVARA